MADKKTSKIYNIVNSAEKESLGQPVAKIPIIKSKPKALPKTHPKPVSKKNT
ncbi:MAG TPA: hypothetical protein VM123_16375 [archaeon]|nr:hypothetical protein [archaeon]